MKKLSQKQIVLNYLQSINDWVPSYQLTKLNTPWGFIGSQGDRRARELSTNDCPFALMNKVERADGCTIGKDKRFTYFRIIK
jgi:hypothetical protein